MKQDNNIDEQLDAPLQVSVITKAMELTSLFGVT